MTCATESFWTVRQRNRLPQKRQFVPAHGNKGMRGGFRDGGGKQEGASGENHLHPIARKKAGCVVVWGHACGPAGGGEEKLVSSWKGETSGMVRASIRKSGKRGKHT